MEVPYPSHRFAELPQRGSLIGERFAELPQRRSLIGERFAELPQRGSLIGENFAICHQKMVRIIDLKLRRILRNYTPVTSCIFFTVSLKTSIAFRMGSGEDISIPASFSASMGGMEEPAERNLR